MPVTRPETWALLKDDDGRNAETARPDAAAKAGMQRIDPIFVAETPAGSEALSHMRPRRNGLRLRRRAPAERACPGDGDAYRVRDAVLLRRAEVEPAIASLARADRGRADWRHATSGDAAPRRQRPDRPTAGRIVEAAQAVLADDAAHRDLSRGSPSGTVRWHCTERHRHADRADPAAAWRR